MHKIRGGKNWFLPPVLTGLNRLAETPSGSNCQKLKWPKLLFSAQQWFETYKCVSRCYWDALGTLPHWFSGL